MATQKRSPVDWKANARAAKKHALSDRTRKAYTDQWRWFSEWCAEQQETALPADPMTVAEYLTAKAEGRLEA